MKTNELYKRYVLNNIEKFCDTGSLNEIDCIQFGELEYGCDFEIQYLSGSSDMYSYEKNVKPFIDETLR